MNSTDKLYAASLLTCLLLAGVAAQEAEVPTGPACAPAVVAGEVSHGQRFEKEFGPGLLFRLDPETSPKNPQGWILEVRSKLHPDHDYLKVATPPYRFSNPRYLDTGYGRTAQEAVAWSPRDFRFVLTEDDYATLDDALGYLLWPGTHSEESVEAARGRWRQVLDSRTSAGKLTILDSRLAPPGPDDAAGRIEWIKFEVELCLGAETTGGGIDEP